MAEQQAQTTDPTSAVASGLVRLMLSMEALYSRQSRKVGLTAQQAQLLCTAARRKAGLGEIAEVLHCDRSNVSRLLDRVTRRGLAHRAADTRDGRVSVLELSPGGQAIVNSFEIDLAARLGNLIAGWPARKRQATASILAALINAIQHDLDEEDRAENRADHRAVAATRRLQTLRPSLPAKAIVRVRLALPFPHARCLAPERVGCHRCPASTGLSVSPTMPRRMRPAPQAPGTARAAQALIGTHTPVR